MEPLDAFLIGVAVLSWGFVGFSVKNQYRYATRLFDMLLFYPALVVISFFLFFPAVYQTFDLTSVLLLNGAAGIICLVLFYYSMKWASDYSKSNYMRFLDNIRTEQFAVHSFRDYTANKIDLDKVNIIIRHDVDISLKRSKRMAEIEKTMGIRSTYFFRLHAEKYRIENAEPLIKKLFDDSFEIGLHYETLSIARGDKSKAIELLTEDIDKLRKIAPTGVVAAHGQKGYKNRDIWEDVDKEALQISSAYDVKHDLYLSDAGGKRLTGKDGKYLFDRIYEAKPGQVVQVLIHPDWWY